jgi:translation initiation factor 3 subunit L
MAYVNGNRPVEFDDDDRDEEALVADYQEQVNYEGGEGLERGDSLGGPADLRAQLEAAAAPLEYQAVCIPSPQTDGASVLL